MHFQFRIIGGTIGEDMGFTTKISGIPRCMTDSTLRDAIRCSGSGFVLAALLVAAAATDGFSAPDFAARARHDYESSLAAWRGSTTNVTGAVAVARAAFLYADFPMEDDQRAEIARRGIEAGREAVSAQ